MTAVPIVLNPVAGGGRLLRRRGQLDAAAHALGVDLDWHLTERRGHAEGLARRQAELGVPLVLAWGGDGTYNEVARGLMGSSTALGPLPGGTTSVLAYELGVPRPAQRALEALLDGCNRTMRPGRTDRGDIFLLMLSSGPDARVLERVSAEYKRLGGRLGIAAGAARELLRREPLPTLRCRLDGNGVIGGGWVIVGRSRSYGGPYHATPGADPFAGPLEAVIQRSVGRRSALGFVVAMLFGFHVRRNDVLRSATQDVQLESVNGEVPYQIDGDPAGNLPVRIGIDGRELLLRVPSGRTRS